MFDSRYIKVKIIIDEPIGIWENSLLPNDTILQIASSLLILKKVGNHCFIVELIIIMIPIANINPIR
tara:strand:- start:97 stop:297 length:201 start_codon:yes stop_codon:yes gene_type:complete